MIRATAFAGVMLTLACSESATDTGLDGVSAQPSGTLPPTPSTSGGATTEPPVGVASPSAMPSSDVESPDGVPSTPVTSETGGTGSGAAGAGGMNPVPSLGGGGAAGAGDVGGSGPGPSARDAGAAGVGAGPPVANPAVIDDLTTYLEQPSDERSPLEAEPFASTPLTREQAAEAQELLWDDHVARIRREREAENQAQSLSFDEYTLRYAFTVFGEAPEEGRSLYLSLHGGGEADAATNDSQWENQQVLYEPDEGIYLSPRAPTDTWNMWHQEHIDPLFTRLIENLIVFEGVNPNRVYVMGYSAGGDGVYQLGPRMADSWAAAAMMAGHPNDAQPLSLRNIGFAIHVGELDTAFERNAIAADWGLQLDALQDSDPEGYEHQVEVHAGKPHWMDLEDAVAVPWMAEFTRDPIPTKVIWLQDDAPHERFYWLRLSEVDWATGVLVEASYEGQTVTVEGVDLDGDLEVMLNDAMLDLDEPVNILTPDGDELFLGVVDRTIGDLYRTLEERGDPTLMFSANVSVTLP
jgi:predicted peptidase